MQETDERHFTAKMSLRKLESGNALPIIGTSALMTSCFHHQAKLEMNFFERRIWNRTLNSKTSRLLFCAKPIEIKSSLKFPSRSFFISRPDCEKVNELLLLPL